MNADYWYPHITCIVYNIVVYLIIFLSPCINTINDLPKVKTNQNTPVHKQ